MLSMLTYGQTASTVPPADPTHQINGEVRGVYWAQGEAPFLPPARNVNMTYHGGKIMNTTVAKSIFWGTSWASYSGDKITGMDSWYQGFGNSNYAKTSDEY